jgi:Uncharacterised protein family, YAP/Alf4/glomulin
MWCFLAAVEAIVGTASVDGMVLEKIYAAHTIDISTEDSIDSLLTNRFIIDPSIPPVRTTKGINIIGAVAAATKDSLALVQSLINATVSCPDSALRSSAFTFLRQLLGMFEERSRTCLLRRLIHDCPFPHITGLLIDVVKDCVQSASKGQSWGIGANGTNTRALFLSEAGEVAVGEDLEAGRKGSGSRPDGSLHECTGADKLDWQLLTWQGASPFWSPLMLQTFVNKVLHDAGTQSTAKVSRSQYICPTETPTVSFTHALIHTCIHAYTVVCFVSQLTMQLLENIDAITAVSSLLNFLSLRLRGQLFVESGPSMVTQSTALLQFFGQAGEEYGSEDGERVVLECRGKARDLLVEMRGTVTSLSEVRPYNVIESNIDMICMHVSMHIYIYIATMMIIMCE